MATFGSAQAPFGGTRPAFGTAAFGASSHSGFGFGGTKSAFGSAPNNATRPFTVPIAHRAWLKVGALRLEHLLETPTNKPQMKEDELLSADLAQYQQEAIDRGVALARVPFARSPQEITRALVDEAHYQPMDENVLSEASAQVELAALEHEGAKVAAELLQRLDQARLKLEHARALRLRSEASPAQRLYADALQVVLGFLPMSDVAAAIRTCRTYYRISRRVNIATLQDTTVEFVIANHSTQLASFLISPLLWQVRRLHLTHALDLRSDLMTKLLSGLTSIKEFTLVVDRKSNPDDANESPLVLPVSLEKFVIISRSPPSFGAPIQTSSSSSNTANSKSNRLIASLSSSRLPHLREVSLTWIEHSSGSTLPGQSMAGLNLEPLLAVKETLETLTLNLPANQLSEEQITILAQVMCHIKELCSPEHLALRFPADSQSQLVKLTMSQASLMPLLSSRVLGQLTELCIQSVRNLSPPGDLRFDFLREMRQLRKLTLEHLPAPQLGSSLDQCTELRDLTISRCKLEPSVLGTGLATLPHLERFTFEMVGGRSEVDWFATFSGLTNLRYLSVELSTITQSSAVRHLVPLIRLEELVFKSKFEEFNENDPVEKYFHLAVTKASGENHLALRPLFPLLKSLVLPRFTIDRRPPDTPAFGTVPRSGFGGRASASGFGTVTASPPSQPLAPGARAGGFGAPAAPQQQSRFFGGGALFGPPPPSQVPTSGFGGTAASAAGAAPSSVAPQQSPGSSRGFGFGAPSSTAASSFGFGGTAVAAAAASAAATPPPANSFGLGATSRSLWLWQCQVNTVHASRPRPPPVLVNLG